jgi:Protein of unknown function (DUF1588)/Protein of unknown function (DUF1592)/Protein of unknown function (DUF1585)
MRCSFIIGLAGFALACNAAPRSADSSGGAGSDGAVHTGGGGNGSASGGNGSASGASGPAAAVFNCDASAKPEELPLPRLSRAQLEGTLKSAIALALPDDADAIWATVSARFAQYPSDQRSAAPGDLKGGYSRFDQSIQLSQVQAMYAVGIDVAAQLTASPARLTKLLGACATDSSAGNDRACLEDFLRRWASRVMRSELGAEDVKFYADMAEDTPVEAAAVADVIATVLNAPETLYRVEHGTSAGEISELSPFELAARLALNLWQQPPDDELWQAARDGSLLDADVYAHEVERLLTDSRLRGALDEWIAEWLRLGELPPLDTLNDDPGFIAFAGAELPTSGTRQAMIDDVLESAWSVLKAGQATSALLSDRASYAKDPILARIYGVPVWDGTAPPPLISSANRSGLLTRAALLTTGTAGTRPIHKGYLVRNALLCQQLGAPPMNANTQAPVASGQQTTRQVVTARTSPASCVGCHAIINPAGFITESFDALGRERSAEKIYDDKGELLGSLELDTSAVPAVTSGDKRAMTTAAELTQSIGASRLFQSCLARHYFRFASARAENPERDGCVLAKLEAVARSDAPLAEVLKTLVTDETFKKKRFE